MLRRQKTSRRHSSLVHKAIFRVPCFWDLRWVFSRLPYLHSPHFSLISSVQNLISPKMPAYHSKFEPQLLVGNMAVLPLRSNFRGPAPSKTLPFSVLQIKVFNWKTITRCKQEESNNTSFLSHCWARITHFATLLTIFRVNCKVFGIFWLL